MIENKVWQQCMPNVAYASNEILQSSQNDRVCREVDENDPTMFEVKYS